MVFCRNICVTSIVFMICLYVMFVLMSKRYGLVPWNSRASSYRGLYWRLVKIDDLRVCVVICRYPFNTFI